MAENELVPYIGPRPFEHKKDDSVRFFGRSKETEEIVSLIFGHPVTLVYAQSGAGKTSLFNASVTVRLEENNFDVLPLTRVGGAIPKGIPVQEIKNLYIFNALLKMDPETEPQEQLTRSLSEFLKARLRTTDEDGQMSPQAIIFDQFEELFTFTPEDWRDQRDGFFRQVVEALDADPLLRVVFLIREDFLAELDPYAQNLPERLRARYRLERLREEAALQAIKDPLANTHRKFAPGVAEDLVKELQAMRTIDATGEMADIEGQYVEPVQLQVVCVTLWSSLSSSVTEIQQDHLKDFDVNDALSIFYESIVEDASRKTGVTEADLRTWFGEKLITPVGTRHTAFRGEKSTEGIDNNAVDFLESRHIIRAEFRAGARWYELTHDRLVEPIIKNNKEWDTKNSSYFRPQAEAWDEGGRKEFELLSGDALEVAQQWARENPDKLIPLEDEFLKAAKASQERRDFERAQKRADEQTRWFRVLLALLALAIIMSLFAVNRTIQANRSAENAQTQQAVANDARLIAETKQAEAESWRKVARSNELSSYAFQMMENNPSLSILLSVEAFKKDVNRQSHSTLLLELQKYSNLWGFLNISDPSNDIQFSPDGQHIATFDNDNGFTLWDTSNLEKLTEEPVNGHFGPVYSVAVSPDGTVLASGGGDGDIILRNMTNFEEIPESPLEDHTNRVWSLAFSPDGTKMASGSYDKSVILWDVATWNMIGLPLRGHEEEIINIAFSPDGKMVASGSLDDTVRLWDVENGGQIGGPLTGHTGNVYAVAFSPDSKTLASAGADDTIILWDVENGTQIGEPLSGHQGNVRCIDFSPDGKYLASGGYDDTVILWDRETNEEFSRFAGFTDNIYSIKFSPDSRVLAVGDGYGDIGLLSIAEPEPVYKKNHSQDLLDYAVYDLAFDPTNSSTMVSGSRDSTVVIWDISDISDRRRIGEPLLGHPGQPTGMSFDPGGKIIFSDGDDGTVLYHIESQKWTKPLDYFDLSADNRIAAHRSTDSTTGQPGVGLVDLEEGDMLGVFLGEYVSMNGDGSILVSETDSSILVWDTGTGAQIGRGINGSYEALSADGKVLISRYVDSDSGENLLGIWDTGTGAQIGRGIDGSYEALSADGKVLISRYVDSDSGENLLGIWDTGAGTQIGMGIDGSYEALSTDGKVLISRYVDSDSGENLLGIWDTGAGAQIGRGIDASFKALSPDSKILITSDESLFTFWDTESGAQFGNTFNGPYENISPDGNLILFRDANNQIGFWETTTWSLGNRVKDSPVNVNIAALSPDGMLIALYAGEGIVLQGIDGTRMGEPLQTSKMDVIVSLNFSIDGTLLASCDSQGQTTLWNINSREAVVENMQGCHPVFSPDGKYMALSDVEDETTSLWDMSSYRVLTEDPIPGIKPSFSNDGNLLMTIQASNILSDSESGDAGQKSQATPTTLGINTLTIWDIGQGEPKQDVRISCSENSINSGDSTCVTALFSPMANNTIVYSNGSEIFFWESSNRELPTKPAIIVSTDVRELGFIKFEQISYLISEDKEGISTIWDININSMVGEPIAGEFQLSSSVSQNDSLLYIDNGGNLILWDLDPDKWIDQLCESAGRNIYIDTEWKRWFPNEEAPSSQEDATCPQWPLVMEPEVSISPAQ